VKKIILASLLVLILGLMIIIFNRNILARFIIIQGIKKTCGLGVNIKSLNIGLPSVSISGLSIYNPSGFKERLMADIPEIYVDFDLPAFLKNKVHLGKLKIEINEVDVILNEKGKLNVNSLSLLAPKKGTGKPPEIQIDELSLKISKVVYKGYFPVAGIKSMDFNPNIDEIFYNVTDPSKLSAQIMQRILSRIGIENLAKFGSEAAQKAIEGVETEAKEAVEKAKKDVLEKTKQGLESILPSVGEK